MNRKPKQVLGAKEGQSKLKTGINTLKESVGSTLGPNGRTVIIEDDNIIGGVEITKDGVTVSESIHLADPVENIGAHILKETARQTYMKAGDGTTTSIVLASSMINNFDSTLGSNAGLSQTDLVREVVSTTNKMIDAVDGFSIKLDDLTPSRKEHLLKNVATISSNNDEEIGKLISGLFMKTENVVIQDSKTNSTHEEFIEGIVLDKGFVSQYFINDEKSRSCVFENPIVLLHNKEIYDLESIMPLMNESISTKRPLVIIGTLSPNALNSFIYSCINSQGRFNGVVITPPAFGFKTHEIMRDLAEVFNCTYYSDTTGDNKQIIDPSTLAPVAGIVVREDRTIIQPYDNQKEAIANKLASLKHIKENDNTDESIDLRIKTISSSIGIIHVGANSKIEAKEKKARIDDAVRSVYSAIEQGVIVGAGKTVILAYQKVYDEMTKDKSVSEIEEASLSIMESVAFSPLIQMLENSGMTKEQIDEVVRKVSNSDPESGYNVKTRQYTNLLQEGVLDPTKVLKTALSNAISVASTIMDTSCVITNLEKQI